MAYQVPTAEDVRSRLASLERGQLQRLASDSKVALSTLTNIRDSEKRLGPSVDTLRKFWPLLVKMTREKAKA
jgi:hypothetical protein